MTSVLPSTTLFREGPDLDEILAELDEEYPGRVRVVDVEYDRSGGMLGFFAHRLVRVRYTVEDGPADESQSVSGPTGAGLSPLEELLSAAAADDVIGSRRTAAAPQPVVAPADSANVEFARMLLDMAAAKAATRRAAEPAPIETSTASAPSAVPMSLVLPSAAPILPSIPEAGPVLPTGPTEATTVSDSQETSAPYDTEVEPALSRHRADDPVTDPVTDPATDPVTDPVTESSAPHRSSVERAPASLSPEPRVDRPGRHRATASPARLEFSLRRALVEVGVPVHWVPEHATDAYRVVEDLAAAVRNVPVPRLQPGQVLAIVGPAVEALRTADQLSRQLRLDPSAVLAAGCAAPAHSSLHQPWDVAAAVARARAKRKSPLILVVASDGSGDGTGESDDEWLREVLRSASAEHLWLVADATRKPADARAMLDTIDRVDALAVTGAARTASPASVWGLGVPVALLDGRPATRGGWAVLLIDKLAALES